MSIQTNDLGKKFREDWFQFNPFIFFVLLCLLSVALLLMKKNFVIDGLAAFEILNDRGESGVINLIFSLQYFSVPIFYLWKFTLITVFIWISSFFFGYKLLYTRLWKLVMLMEAVFILPELLKILWFIGDTNGVDYWEVKAFYPFSVLSILNFENIAERWHYPLKALNIFEVIYWILLFFGIHSLANKKRKIAKWIVISGYIIPFFLWLLFYVAVYK
ncbi:MAG: hypothetical protein WBA74_08020 [Cyclobacteriaceae bacterium]